MTKLEVEAKIAMDLDRIPENADIMAFVIGTITETDDELDRRVHISGTSKGVLLIGGAVVRNLAQNIGLSVPDICGILCLSERTAEEATV